MNKNKTRRLAILIQEQAEHYKQPFLASVFNFDGNYDGLQARICGIADGYVSANLKGAVEDYKKALKPEVLKAQVEEAERDYRYWSVDAAHVSLNEGKNFIWLYVCPVP